MLKFLADKYHRWKFRGYNLIEGWLKKDEASTLYNLARKLPKNATVVEIGSWQGKSTLCLAKGLRSGVIYAIDPFNADAGDDAQSQEMYRSRHGNNDLLEVFKNNMRTHHVLQKIRPMQGYSHEFADAFREIDLLFIDGDHSIKGCTDDFNMYAPKVKAGGFIAFHDYHSDRPDLGPTHVIENIIKKSADYQFVGQWAHLWVAKKSAKN